MKTAHVISRRPHLVDQAVITARREAELVIVGLHGVEPTPAMSDVEIIQYAADESYIDLTNDVLRASADYAPVSLRIDDDDYYPEGHGQILDHWEPGHMLWGECELVGCNGRRLKRNHPDMCAGAIPTDVTVIADARGTVAASLRILPPIVVPTGVIKQVCFGDVPWATAHWEGWHRRVQCTHNERTRYEPR